MEKEKFNQKLESATTQKERWGLFYQRDLTEEQKELVLWKIFDNARNIGEIGKVHLHSARHGALEAESMDLLGNPQGLIIPPV